MPPEGLPNESYNTQHRKNTGRKTLAGEIPLLILEPVRKMTLSWHCRSLRKSMCVKDYSVIRLVNSQYRVLY